MLAYLWGFGMRKWSALVWAAGFAILAAVALDRCEAHRKLLERAAQPEPKPLSEFKAEAIKAADLTVFHHLIYERVGEERWEAYVKPAFAKAVLLRVIDDTGHLLPDPEEILEWLRKYPDEAKELLERAAEPDGGGPAKQGRIGWREL